MNLKATETTAVFGLTYLEEEDIEITDVVGCTVPTGAGGFTSTGCDDTDIDPIFPPVLEDF